MTAVPPPDEDVLQPASTPDTAGATEQGSNAGRERILQVCSSPGQDWPGNRAAGDSVVDSWPGGAGKISGTGGRALVLGTKPGITWVFAGQQIPAYPELWPWREGGMTMQI